MPQSHRKQFCSRSAQKYVFGLKLRNVRSNSDQVNLRPYLSVVSSSPRVAVNSLEISGNKSGLATLRQGLDKALSSDREQRVEVVLADGSTFVIYIERDDDPLRWKLRGYSLASRMLDTKP